MKDYYSTIIKLFFIFFLPGIAPYALPQTGGQKLIPLHDKVGSVIDAEENNQYHLFSKDVGLMAVKLYQLSPESFKWSLHIIGEKMANPIC